MVGSNSRQFRVRYLSADHLDAGVSKDMIDASEWKAPKKRFFGAMVGQFNLRIKKKGAEPAAYIRGRERIKVAA